MTLIAAINRARERHWWNLKQFPSRAPVDPIVRRRLAGTADLFKETLFETLSLTQVW